MRKFGTRAAVGTVMGVVCAASPALAQSIDLGNLESTVGTGVLTAAVGLHNAPGDPVDRLFVVEQTGRISIITLNRTTNPIGVTRVTFLDASALITPSGGTIVNPTVEDTPFGPTRTQTGSYTRVRQNEQGFLGMAFHPDYNTPGAVNQGVFWVYYTAPRGVYGYSNTSLTCWDLSNIVVVRYRRSSGNPDSADTSTAKTILTVAEPYWNHNGGCMQFGPDGMLYISPGDGGSGGDPNNFAQNLNYRLGKILRIDASLQAGDVWASYNYRIPAGNPYAGGGGLPEIWANGIRNAWRFTFDRRNGDLYVADVGQDAWEEINWLPAGTGAGANFGWRRWEGTHSYNAGTALTPNNHLSPVYDYPHTAQGAYTTSMIGNAVIGGYCYHGRAIPGWRGRYFFADQVTNRIWSIRMINGVASDFQIHTTHLNTSPAPTGITSFGEDNNGEMYLVQGSGRIRKIIPQLPQPNLADVVQSSGLPGPDGFVTGADFDFFVEQFFKGSDLADIATEGNPNLNAGPDGFVTGIDFDAYIIFYFTAA